MSMSLESAHFSPSLPPSFPRRGYILITYFACIFLDFSGCGKSPDHTITSQSITLKSFFRSANNECVTRGVFNQFRCWGYVSSCLHPSLHISYIGNPRVGVSWDDSAGVSSDHCKTWVAVGSGGLGHTSPSCLLSSVECGVCWEELGQPLELCRWRGPAVLLWESCW